MIHPLTHPIIHPVVHDVVGHRLRLSGEVVLRILVYSESQNECLVDNEGNILVIKQRAE